MRPAPCWKMLAASVPSELTEGAGAHHQPVFHLVGGEVRVLLQHQGHDARGNGRCRRCARTQIPAPRTPQLRIRLGVGAVFTDVHQQMGPRSQHVRFDEASLRGAGSAERRHVVVVEVQRRVVVGKSANGHDKGIVAWRGDGASIRAAVARCRDDHNTFRPQPLNGLVDWVVPVGVGYGTRQRHVHHANVVGVFVVQNPVQTGDDAGSGAHAGPT
jgi:hypothetical protein